MENISDSLVKKAILVKVTVHKHDFSERDDERIMELSEKYGVDPKLLNLKKTTMMKEFTKSIDKIIGSINPLFHELTLPWKDGGWRLLNVNTFTKFEKAFREKNEELKEALEDFIPSYSEFINRTKLALGGMSDNIAYPDPAYLKQRYYFELKYDPLVTSNDFRIEVSNDVYESVRKNFEDNYENSIKEAMNNVWNRVISAINRLYERFTAEEFEWTNSKGESVLRKPRLCNSIIEDIKSLIAILPDINITSDPNLNAIRQELESKFANIDMNEIKENSQYKKEKAKEAEKILNDIKAFI
jgi:hypothetical protein